MKDPAFLFYPGDWLGGTMHLDFEAKGAYLELLMLQFQRGHMTYDMIAHVLGQRCGQIWPKIQDKFQTDGVHYWNERLNIEKQNRIDYVNSRKNNRNGTNQHTKKEGKKVGHMTNHTVGHMENENKDVLSINKESVIRDKESAWKELTGDEMLLEDARLTISQKGWNGHKDVDIHGCMFTFIAKIEMPKARDELRQYWRNWLFRESTDKLRDYGKNYRQRIERQAPEVH